MLASPLTRPLEFITLVTRSKQRKHWKLQSGSQREAPLRGELWWSAFQAKKQRCDDKWIDGLLQCAVRNISQPVSFVFKKEESVVKMNLQVPVERAIDHNIRSSWCFGASIAGRNSIVFLYICTCLYRVYRVPEHFCLPVDWVLLGARNWHFDVGCRGGTALNCSTLIQTSVGIQWISGLEKRQMAAMPCGCRSSPTTWQKMTISAGQKESKSTRITNSLFKHSRIGASSGLATSLNSWEVALLLSTKSPVWGEPHVWRWALGLGSEAKRSSFRRASWSLFPSFSLCFRLSFGLSNHLSHEVVGLTAAHFGAKFAWHGLEMTQ